MTVVRTFVVRTVTLTARLLIRGPVFMHVDHKQYLLVNARIELAVAPSRLAPCGSLNNNEGVKISDFTSSRNFKRTIKKIPLLCSHYVYLYNGNI